jgi:hypothetical protein
MSTKKKVSTPKTVVPSPKYAIGQLVFIVDESRSSYGEVLQAEVEAIRSIKFSTKSDTGKTIGSETRFEYDVMTANGRYSSLSEYRLYPSLTAVSLAFTNRFVHLLK